MPEPSALATPFEPTAANERVTAIDAVRGFAVLGILAMNIVEFGLPMQAYENPAFAGGTSGLDLWFWYAQVSLFDGKMRALFSMLFGAGLILIADRMTAKGRSADVADYLLRRCLWLVPLGIVHRFLLQWTGDILYIYGLLGVLAVAFRRLGAKALLVLGVLVLAGQTPQGVRRYQDAVALRAEAQTAAAKSAAGEEVSKPLLAAKERWERRVAAVPPKPDAHQAEIDAMRGSWLAVARYRWDHNHAFQSSFLYSYFVFDALGMILLGMGLAKARFFHGEWRRASYLAWTGIGAASAAAGLAWALWFAAEGFSLAAIDVRVVHDLAYPFSRLLVALGFASALLLVVRSGRCAGVLGALANVGRVAFSNYVLQTVLCTSLFLGWGFGRYGSLSRSALAGVFLAVTAAQLAWSGLWLRRFRFGPLEWLWRSLTLWHRQRLRA